jgi:hypothetical protein
MRSGVSATSRRRLPAPQEAAAAAVAQYHPLPIGDYLCADDGGSGGRAVTLPRSTNRHRAKIFVSTGR